MDRTAYKNQHIREHYDRINFVIPKEYKERIKTAAAESGASVNEFIFTVLCNEMHGTGEEVKHKNAFSDEEQEMLSKLQISKKYFEMIEDMSYSKENGYHIYLKVGYINDVSGSRHVYTQNDHDMRLDITRSHKLGKAPPIRPKKSG